MGWGGHIYFNSKLCIDSSNNLILNFDNDSKLEKSYALNRVSFTGTLKNLLIQNENKENQYFLKYDKPTLTSLIFYKPKNIIYIIIVSAFEGRKDSDIGLGNLNLK